MEGLIQKKLVLEKKEYITMHLNIVNSFLPNKMTPTEIEVLVSFLCLSKELTGDYLFNTEARKRVMEELKMQPGGLGNHLNSLIKKQILTKGEYTNKIELQPFLEFGEKTTKYQFLIKLK